MNPEFAMLGWMEMIVMTLVVLLYFGAKGLPEMFQGMGPGVRRFLRTTHDLNEELSPETEKESGLVYEALTHDNHTAEFVYPQRLETMPSLIVFIAEGFGAGRCPKAPGTCGTVVGLAWFALLLWPGSLLFYLLGILASVFLSVWICGEAERILKRTDPPSVVLDEIIAVPISFAGWVLLCHSQTGVLPSAAYFFQQNLPGILGVFGLFRVFDVAKPWPVRQSQSLPGGWGVTVDDVLAAGYVNLVVLLFLLLHARVPFLNEPL